MRRRSFRQGMGKLMNNGMSKQHAYNRMKLLARWNAARSASKVQLSSSWLRPLGAVIAQIILFAYHVPTRQDVQVMLIKTIIPLSPGTQPLSWTVTLIAALLQAYAAVEFYNAGRKLYNAVNKLST